MNERQKIELSIIDKKISELQKAKEELLAKRPLIGDYDIKVIDGCEYIEIDKSNGNTRVYSSTHKGNCINHEK